MRSRYSVSFATSALDCWCSRCGSGSRSSRGSSCCTWGSNKIFQWTDYQLDGFGWASATVGGRGFSVDVTASYLRDALGDLVRAMESLLQGGTDARCSWEEEPGEYRWIFTSDGIAVSLGILQLPDNFPTLDDAEGIEIFRTSASLSDLASDFANEAQRVLDQYCKAGNLRHWWRHPFPTELLREVQLPLAGADILGKEALLHCSSRSASSPCR